MYFHLTTLLTTEAILPYLIFKTLFNGGHSSSLEAGSFDYFGDSVKPGDFTFFGLVLLNQKIQSACDDFWHLTCSVVTEITWKYILVNYTNYIKGLKYEELGRVQEWQ